MICRLTATLLQIAHVRPFVNMCNSVGGIFSLSRFPGRGFAVMLFV